MDEEVRLTSKGRQAEIRLALLDTEQERYPSAELSVTVRDGDFTGRVRAWVEREELRTFVAAVAACEEARDGSARLTSMGPGELDLRLVRCDGWGHFAMRYEISEHGPTSSGWALHRLSGEFELDAERFGNMARELAEFVRQAFAG